MGFIYIIKNKINDKVYVGQTTKTVEERFKQHKKLSKSSSNQLIHKAIKKYGKENFYIETLECCENILLDEREIIFIKLYNSFKDGYNLCEGGNQAKRQRIALPEEEIISMYSSGKSSRFISELHGVSHGTILNVVNRNSVTRNRNCGLKKYSKIHIEELTGLLNLGISKTQIAIKLHVNHNAVSKAIKRFNL